MHKTWCPNLQGPLIIVLIYQFWEVIRNVLTHDEIFYFGVLPIMRVTATATMKEQHFF